MKKNPFTPMPARKKFAHEKETREFFGSPALRKEEEEGDLSPEDQEFDYVSTESSYLDENPEMIILRWRGPEYEIYPKSSLWYACAVAVILIIAVVAVSNNAPIPAFLFVLIGAVGYLYLNTPPRVVDFAVTYEGIVADDRLFPYENIDSFWIIYEPPHTRVISLKLKEGMFVHTHIPLHQIDPVDVREAMLAFIPERRQDPTLVDTIERLLHI